ncbi:Uncharacterised protein [Mycobacteroides abscessus subsp. abscessus]|nr:Uncharacterised protein [Mycobacteroides abscessus subsp. abscessus]
MVDGEARPAGSCQMISVRYFPYNAAWSLVPRATKSTNRGLYSTIFAATSAIAERPSESSRPHTVGCWRISSAMCVPAVMRSPIPRHRPRPGPVLRISVHVAAQQHPKHRRFLCVR